MLLFGNGYDSQILFMALHELGKRFIVVHAVNGDKILSRKTTRILKKFGYPHIILRPDDKDAHYKSFCGGDPFTFEKMTIGFSAKDYFIIAGFKADTEPPLVKAFYNGAFDELYCPLLRLCDENIEQLYQDMKDNTRLGDFLFENLNSDSPHNITIN